MRRLYLQVYFTIVGSLILVVLTAGVVWHFIANVPPFGEPFELAGELAAGLVPSASASREVQQQAISRLSARSGTDVALFTPPASSSLPRAGPSRLLAPQPSGAAVRAFRPRLFGPPAGWPVATCWSTRSCSPVGSMPSSI